VDGGADAAAGVGDLLSVWVNVGGAAGVAARDTGADTDVPTRGAEEVFGAGVT
jgi:hypothetical protein